MTAENKDLLTTNRKALSINLDAEKYGTLAEIGAGQEVARYFFQAGGASATIAKSISAYDMTFSDAIYGKAPRYVSRERLARMLDHEYELLCERLQQARGERTAFFVFANTVATKSPKAANDAHGWMGIRFQTRPGEIPSEITVHVRMWDKETVLQQQAVGIIGINLIYAAFNYRDDLPRFIQSLADQLGSDRIEVDMLRFSGPAFPAVDNRLVAIQLVQNSLTNAVILAPDGDVLVPAETFYKKAVLVERGSFRPVTRVNLDMMRCATARFAAEPEVTGRDVVALMEISMHNLLGDEEVSTADLLARADLLAATGHTVLISNLPQTFRLTAYIRRYTREMTGVTLGINTLGEVFNEKHYEQLEGGVLEAVGRLFRNAVRLYVYPTRPANSTQPSDNDAAHPLLTAENIEVAPRFKHLYAHLLANRHIEHLHGHDGSLLGILSRDVLRQLQSGDPQWENGVAPEVANLIKDRRLFGYPSE